MEVKRVTFRVPCCQPPGVSVSLAKTKMSEGRRREMKG
jgi:hypothetical protein